MIWSRVNQVSRAGQTPEQITEAITEGEKVAVQNLVNPANGATRFISPATGQSVLFFQLPLTIERVEAMSDKQMAKAF